MTIKKEIKHHRVLLETIESFKKPKSGKLISKMQLLNGKKATFKPRMKEFTIEFQCNISSNRRKDIDLGKYYKGIQIQFGKEIYNLESVFLGNYAPPELTGMVDNIHTIGFLVKGKYYYQLIIPLERELQFHFNIAETHFLTDLGYSSRTGTTAKFGEESIHVCCIQNKKKDSFLAIDSVVKQSFDEFAEKANAVRIGMGYLAGYYAGDRGFFFAYTKKDKKHPKHFRCVALRDSIRSEYCPIYSNAYGYLHQNRPLADKYYPLLRPVSIDEFSNLCEKIHNSVDFSSTLMLMLESSVASLLFMPGGFAIALETISDLVIENKKLKLAPIKDKAVSKKIRIAFLEILNQNSETIPVNDLDILKKRIEQFNQTTNKARLRAPFDLLEIKLFEKDLKILETRNDFLHGRVPDLTNVGTNRSTDRINKDLYYCSMKFYTLLNIIILRWIGYDNRVVNYPKIHDGFTQIHLEEEPFRQV